MDRPLGFSKNQKIQKIEDGLIKGGFYLMGDFIEQENVWVKNSKVDMTRRQFTLQLLLFYEKFDIAAPDNQPYIKPLLVFAATPAGYDKE